MYVCVRERVPLSTSKEERERERGRQREGECLELCVREREDATRERDATRQRDATRERDTTTEREGVGQWAREATRERG